MTKKQIIHFILIFAIAGILLVPYSKFLVRKKLKIATSADFIPFEYLNEKKELVGFDIELMEELAKRKNHEVEWSNVKFNTIIGGIILEYYDVGISAISITEKRKKMVSFTDSYYDAALNILFYADNKSVVGFDESIKGLKVGAKLGTREGDLAKEFGAKIVEFETTDDLILALEQRKVDAIVSDAPWIDYYLKTKKNENLKKGENIVQPEKWAIIVSRDDKELLKELNEALKEVIEDGTYQKIKDKYL